MNRFKIVMTGRNHAPWAVEALDSVAAQTDRFDVCMVDDASDDDNALYNVLQSYGERYGWLYFRRGERRYALENQILAWRALEPSDDDVIVWVDLDDRLAVPDALERVRVFYDDGALLTFGSYRPFPKDHPNAKNCRPARPYDEVVRVMRGYRGTIQWFNHLRTVSWKVLKEVSDLELRASNGDYFKANTDRAVFYPCLELAGLEGRFVPDVLYEYRCDSPDAVWKTMNPLLIEEDQQIRSRPARRPL